jgi:hypothetical protein
MGKYRQLLVHSIVWEVNRVMNKVLDKVSIQQAIKMYEGAT